MISLSGAGYTPRFLNAIGPNVTTGSLNTERIITWSSGSGTNRSQGAISWPGTGSDYSIMRANIDGLYLLDLSIHISLNSASVSTNDYSRWTVQYRDLPTLTWTSFIDSSLIMLRQATSGSHIWGGCVPLYLPKDREVRVGVSTNNDGTLAANSCIFSMSLVSPM